MSSDLTIEFDDDDVDVSSWERWGKANDRRGVAYAGLAKTFVLEFPIGTKLANERWDEWLQTQGLLRIPPANVSKDSDAWLGHLQRRHIQRNRLNKAATHPRMTDEGSTPFVVLSLRGGFEVQAPHVAASRAELPRKITSLTETKRKQLGYLMQSSDWSVLPAHEQAIAEAIYDDIDAFTVDTRTAAERISIKLAKLERRIRMLLDAGKVTPMNDGLRRLLGPAEDDDKLS
jgi:hypothetical protein